MYSKRAGLVLGFHGCDRSVRDKNKPEFDSVRGVFFEGKDLYENAGFKRNNHIQIAIRNPNCIKGYFIPRELDPNYPKP